MKKILLCDINGTLMDTATPYKKMIADHSEVFKYINYTYKQEKKIMNVGPYLAYMKPMEGAVETVKNYKQQGFEVHLISCCLVDNNTEEFVHYSLDKYFGAGFFDKVMLLGFDDDKKKQIKKYAEMVFCGMTKVFYVDDTKARIKDAEKIGLKTCIPFKNWEDTKKIISDVCMTR